MSPRSRSSASNRPFEALRDLIDRGHVKLWPDTEKTIELPRYVDDSLTDEEAFRQAMKQVHILGWSEAPLRLPRPVQIADHANDEAEALAQLQAFMEGRGELDPFATGEGVEGASTYRGSLHLGRLKRGQYSVQAHLDLHGLGLAEAKSRFEDFIRRSQRLGHSCVRIIHGRGKHSSSEPGALKTHLVRWLGSRKMSRSVVAFASARWTDGGSGAVYVLLYRKRRA